MNLPSAEAAIIPPEKIRDYLLSSTHPIGRYKAAFFRARGYEQDSWETLAKDIRSLLSAEAIEVEFVTASGRTQALVTLSPKQVRPVGPKDIPSVRQLSAA